MKESVLNGKSKNVVLDNIEKLKKIFPDIVTEDKVDFDKLKLILGEEIDDSNEKYNFTWPGKIKSDKESQKQSTGTLRPSYSDSRDWDTTQNIYIEGDNLEVLKLLQKSYYNRIKMIYIDPPYNTGKDFIYSDDYSDNLENYLKISGQVIDSDSSSQSGVKLTNNLESNGRFHTDWLNMMYPRLKLARNLLSDDGVIFISIDDNEIENLKKICNEIFGEENFIATIIWERAYSPVNLKKHISESHDYALCFSKNIDFCVCNGLKRKDETNNRYQNLDNDSRGPWKPSDLSVGPIIEDKVYEITTPGGRKVWPPEGYCWRLSKERFEEFVKDNRIWFGHDGNNVPAIKRFLSEVKETITPMTIWKYKEVGHSQNAKQNLIKLFGGNSYFDYPKPVEFIKRMVELYSNSNDLILDFFSGSATTAHAVMRLNAEENSKRKFIMIQIPEETNVKSDAFKAGYKNICEIGKERIRLAGDKIAAESDNSNLDIGFKVFKLDSSNLKKWEPDYNNIQQSLITDQIKNDRTDEDLIYEIMLKYGVDLTLPIEKYDNIYSIGFGALIICLEDNITRDIAEEILKISKDSSISRVVFKDNSFDSDEDKTNIKQILKDNHIGEFITI